MSEVIDLDYEESEGDEKIQKRRIRVTQKRRSWSELIPEDESPSDGESVISGISGTVTVGEEKKISDKFDTSSSAKKKQPLQPAETNLQVQVPLEVQSSQKENAAKENTPQIDNEKKTPRKHVSGFDLGLTAEEIVGATDINGFKFLLKWKDYPKMEFIEREVANKKFPQLVIAFYEARIHFDHDQVPLDSPFHPLAVRNLPKPFPE